MALEGTLSAGTTGSGGRGVVDGRRGRGVVDGRRSVVDGVHNGGAAAANGTAVTDGIHVGAGAVLDDVASRVGELQVTTVGDVAGGLRDVGNEHVGKAGGVDAAAATGDLDGGTAHVHLTVAQSVEPGPGESV